MTENKKIRTIQTFNEYCFKEKASQFIGQVYHVETETGTVEVLQKIKKEFYDARHHCYAWKLSEKEFKYSDDGEPNGTAGVRILNAIKHFDLQNVIVISIRYFGGVKLGVGPLGKAYYNSALGALETAQIIELTRFDKIKIIFDYDFTSSVHHFINQAEAKIINSIYESKPALECLIKPEKLINLKESLVEASKGKIAIYELGEIEYLKC